LGERLDRTQEVSGSNPLSSIFRLNQALSEPFNRIRTYHLQHLQANAGRRGRAL
jgi:hypothetical protein